MSVSTVQVLRRFTQKLAAAQGMDLKSSLLAALSDPKVIGGLGGAAAGGVGAYGLAKMTQSEEDSEAGRTPLLAPLLGALAGGAAGAYGGPQMAEMLRQYKLRSGDDSALIGLKPKSPSAGINVGDAMAHMRQLPARTIGPDQSAVTAAPKRLSPRHAQPYAELQDAIGAEGPGGEPGAGPELKFTDGQPDKDFLSTMFGNRRVSSAPSGSQP